MGTLISLEMMMRMMLMLQRRLLKQLKPPEMSLIILEVKPLDDTTSLDDLAKRIFSDIKMEALYWKSADYKKVPVAYGIFKLIIGFSCEDAKVGVDDVIEKIEEFEDMV